jgi:alanyl-tRNA synthetase
MDIKNLRAEFRRLGLEIEPMKFNVESSILVNSCNALSFLRKKERKDLEGKVEDNLEDYENIRHAKDVSGYSILIKDVPGGANALKSAKKDSGGKKIIVAFGVDSDRISIVATRGSADIHMGKLVSEISRILGGRGGGRPDFGQGSGTDLSKIKEAMDFAMNSIRKSLEKG